MNDTIQGLVCCEGYSELFFPTAERARVALAPLPGVKGTDYINASYIMV